jgi:hypothetical protein
MEEALKQNLIHRVLSMIQIHQVRALLMGGQACVLYGGAEFSRDFDFIILIDPDNIVRLNSFIIALNADIMAVPPFDTEYLLKGHAVHFRAKAEGFENLRIDLMAKLRGLDPFEKLWERRTTVELLPTLQVEVLSLKDLVAAKKTRRDKDWPMIKRLVDADYLNFKDTPTEAQKIFWLSELRTYEFLVDIAEQHAEFFKANTYLRLEALRAVLERDYEEFRTALRSEEDKIRKEDEAYWRPLIKELESLRHQARKK